MDAQTAREITKKYLHEQLQGVINNIHDAAKKGLSEANTDDLNMAQRKYLESLGYRIEYMQYNTINKFKISW